MKKFIKDWWPLLVIVGWWLWRKFYKGWPSGKAVSADGTPKKCPKCGSEIKLYEGGNLIEKCTNPYCGYHVEVSHDGEPAGICTYCGAMRYYRYQGSPADGASKINFPVCSNPDCKSHWLTY